MRNLVLRLAAIVAVGVGASACSSVPDWIDPWADSTPSDAGNGKAPELADIPGKPPTTTPDEQRQVADSLAADRAQANHSAEQLRASTESSAPLPAAPSSDATPAAGSNTQSPPSPDQSAASVPSKPEASAQRVAATDSSGAEQAGASSNPAPAPVPAVAHSDAAVGFRPSSAPPLDASVSQYVSPSLLAKYRQTATASSATAAPSQAGVGAQPAASPVAYTDQSGAPAAVVFFPGDGTTLSAAARAKVHEVVGAYRSAGGQGFIRVVGHSSSRTADMPVEQHLQLIFQRSQDRANSVARELIREGVPAAKVLVEAVGDSQPVYYESMPKGEQGNRRAEIFLQS